MTKITKPAAAEAPKATGKAQSAVVNVDGATVRTYTSKEHGKDHAKLAKAFVENPENVKRHGELSVK